MKICNFSKYGVLLVWGLLSVFPILGQHVVTTTGLEYFYDTDPGVGNGTFISSTNFAAGIPTTGLSAGFHILYFRAKGTNTSTYRDPTNYTQFITDLLENTYGLTESRPFYIASSVGSGASTIAAYEYFFDTDPGVGLGTALSSSTITIPTLAEGFHTLYIRAKNGNNQWGLTESKAFLIRPPASASPPTIAAYEYFFDTDPGAGNGTVLTGTAISIPNTLTEGFHTLYVRAKNSDNQWGLTESRPFLIRNPESVTPPTVVAKEYFFDTDPGVGNGTLLTGTAIAVPTSLTSGFHTIYVRSKNSLNQWGLTESRPFYIKFPEEIVPFAINAAEFFFDTDPGAGSGIPITVTSAATLNYNPRALAMQVCLTPGEHRFYLRVRSSTGNWSLHEQQTLTIEPNDVELVSAVVTTNIPTGFPCNPTTNEEVRVIIKNNGVTGNTGVQNIDIGMASVQIVVSGANSGTYTLTNTTTIPVGGSETIVFTGVNLSVRGNNSIVSTVTVCQDAVLSNNSKTISVNTNPLVTVGITSNPLSASVCNGNTVTLTAAGGGGDGIYAYKWDGIGAYSASNASSVYGAPVGTTAHTVSVKDGVGCLASQSQNVTIFPLPTATIGGTTALCQNATPPSVIFTGGTGIAPYTFTYSINSGSPLTVTTTSGNSVSVSQPTSPAGVYTYTLISISDAHTCSQNVTGSAVVEVLACKPLVTAKVYLEGPFNAAATGNSKMNTILSTLNLIPTTEPYTSITGFTHIGGGGGEITTSTILSRTGNNAIIDWIFLELRTTASATTVVYTRSALLQADGNIVDVDGTSPVQFQGMAGSYFLAIRHRNHLTIVKDDVAPFASSVIAVDFTTLISPVSTSKMNEINSLKVMRAGDLNTSATITASDVLKARQANVAGQTNDYKNEDVNMSGKVTATDVLLVRSNNKIN